MTADAPALDMTAYTALTEGAALQARDAWGVLALEDADRIDFLQRMTTNNVATLESGQAMLTILTSPVARVEFVFTVLNRGEALWLLPASSEAEALAHKLRSQIFFMDKVRVRDLSADLTRLRLMGPRGQAVLAAAGLPLPAQDDTFADADGVTVLRQEKFDIPGWELLLAPERRPAVQHALVEAGAVLLSDEEAYTARRVELARPIPGAELTAAVNPLEAGMAWACAEDKGCYTGQEIIARQRTYDKVTKTLVQLRCERRPSPGAAISVEGRAGGTVTSSVFSPAQGTYLALGILRRPHNRPGARVYVDEGIPATVVG